MDRRPETTVDSTHDSAPAVPRPVVLAIRCTWVLVGVMGVVVVLMAVFYDEVVGDWARDRPGAHEAFEQGGRSGLERAGFAPPSYLPVAVTMLVVAALIVWVLTAFLRRGYRWGQLGLVAVVVASAYASVALGIVLGPPPVFVVVAVVAMLVEGVTLACLWHPGTRAHVRGPWRGGPGGPGAHEPPADPARPRSV